MKLRDVAIIQMNYEEADFWLIRRGSRSQCGKPTRVFYKEHIGIKVNQIDLLLPDYLYCALIHVHQSKYWEPIAQGL